MNRMQHIVISAGAALAVAASLSAFAHHGWSSYETESRTLTGTIDRTNYSNPHASIRVKTVEKTWVVVLAPISRMETLGISEAMLKVGSTVSVEGYRHKTDENEMRAERISISGKTIELR